MRTLAIYALAVVAVACTHPGTAGPGGPAATARLSLPTDAPVMPPADMRKYYMVLLRRGPAWTAEATPEAKQISAGHMKYIDATATAGKLLVAGPFLGQTDREDLAGIYIYDVPSLVAAQKLVQGDPAVRAGRFVPEFLVWMAATGLRVDYDPSPPASKAKCETPQRHQFDFWLGDWEVRGPKGKRVGKNSVKRAHGGCALIENWTSQKGNTGISTNHWDPANKKWVQNWIGAGGSIIHLEGGLVGSSMKLAGTNMTADGTTTRLRGTWTPLADGRVRQLFEESKDSGKTWAVGFDGYYSKR